MISTDYLKALIIEYGERGIIVDTNLLLLFVVGFYDIDFISKFKRVKDRGYVENDFEILARLLGLFKCIYITPHILSELSNLSFNAKEIENGRFAQYLKKFIEVISNTNETHIPKEKLMGNTSFKFGFADTSILELAEKENLPVITDDLPLYGLLIQKGIKGINMNHIRDWSI